MSPLGFHDAVKAGNVLVLDTRHLLAFDGAPVPGTWTIGGAGRLSIWAGWMLDPNQPLLLVLESDSTLSEVVTHLARTGFEQFRGYLADGMSRWANAGLPLPALQQLRVTAAAVESQQGTLTLLDVRAPQDGKKGRAPGARHIFLADLPAKRGELSKAKRIAVDCDSGYRPSIAASLLQAGGFDVASIPGSWQAWAACDLQVERE